MSTNIEYQLRDQTGRIDNSGPRHPADRDASNNSRATPRMRIAESEPADYFGALKRRVKSSGGPALLVSLGVIGIPFLIYFVALGAVTVLRTFG